jgi:hypothetical protein
MTATTAVRGRRLREGGRPASSLRAARGPGETLGHSDIRVTMNIYGHVFEAAKHEAACKLHALLSSGPEWTGRP